MVILIEDLFAFVGLLWRYFLLGAAEITRRMALVNPDGRTAGETYWASIRRLFIACASLPIPIVVIAMIGHAEWIIPIVCLFWALCTALLVFAITPLVILADMVLLTAGRSERVGKHYITVAAAILVMELLGSLYLVFVPVGDNLYWLPISLVAFLAYLILKFGTFKSRLAQGVVVILLVLATAAFYKPWVSEKLPESAGIIKNSGPKIDHAVAQILLGNSNDSAGPGKEFPVIHLSPGEIKETGMRFEPGAKLRIISDRDYFFHSEYKPLPYSAGTMECTVAQPGGTLKLQGGDNSATIRVIQLNYSN